MQILANALPGFRDMRAPLMSGYLWLVFIWLLVEPDLTKRPEDAVLRSIYDLATSAGSVWVGIAAGTFAYLAGSVTQMMTEWVEQRLDRRARDRRQSCRCGRRRDCRDRSVRAFEPTGHR